MSTEADIPAEMPAENARALEAWLNRPRRRVSSPSPRKPETSTHFNHADQIERQLQEDGHRTWGFVIYRTCYGNDADWAEFLRRLRVRMEEAFDFFNGRDILDLFTLTVMEDPEHLDGASTAEVREHFVKWCSTAPRSEQPQQQQQQQSDAAGSELRQQPRQGPPRHRWALKVDPAGSKLRLHTGQLSPRYRYAVQVDAASLHSVVHDASAPPDSDLTKKGWVKLIDASWQPISSSKRYDPRHESFEPIEGATEKDVGWMKLPYSHAMDEYYVLSRNLNWWVTSYQRPPVVMGWPYGGGLGE